MAFTLSRYITISNTKSIILNKFTKMSVKKFQFFTLTFSILVNVYIFFEHVIFKSFKPENQFHEFYLANFSSFYRSEKVLDFIENYSNVTYWTLNVFQYIKIIFSDSLYILVTFVIDLFLLDFVRKKMKIKLNLVQAVVKPVFHLIVSKTSIKNVRAKWF